MAEAGMRYHCDHAEQEVRYRQIAGHKELVPFLQCLTCGTGIRAVKNEFVENRIKLRKLNGDPAVFFDETLHRKWLASRMERPQVERDEENRDWWKQYNAHLNTAGWKRRREAVLQRDNGLCQGCRTKRAVHVHHLTYATYNRLGTELLFELTSVCEECHALLHPHVEPTVEVKIRR